MGVDAAIQRDVDNTMVALLVRLSGPDPPLTPLTYQSLVLSGRVTFWFSLFCCRCFFRYDTPCVEV